uniref:Uncharacterized protein n=1 Tax=Romanomermis culicivorax TaxID=13658 RepID=A0A915KB50_ROMCU
MIKLIRRWAVNLRAPLRLLMRRDLRSRRPLIRKSCRRKSERAETSMRKMSKVPQHDLKNEKTRQTA